MNCDDDYISGPHHYWTHFYCGLVYGGGWGAWIGWNSTSGGWQFVTTVIVVALVVALACGRWGNRVWHWLLRF